MIVDNASDFRRAMTQIRINIKRPATAKAAFLITPNQFTLAPESAQDNVYMQMQEPVDSDKALRQHQALCAALARHLPVQVFEGRVDLPDGVFPNNAFAVENGKIILGALKHRVRQAEIERPDIRAFFTSQGYVETDLSGMGEAAELTGSLIIDHARNIGYAGLSERCTRAGAMRMHEAFGLDLTYCFPLVPSEYHTNVVLSILAGRAAVIAPDGFVHRDDADAIAAVYGDHAIVISADEKNNFVGNCIALDATRVWMSTRAERALRTTTRDAFARAGFTIESVDLSELEKAGGSLRCCVAEVF